MCVNDSLNLEIFLNITHVSQPNTTLLFPKVRKLSGKLSILQMYLFLLLFWVAL